MNFTGGAPVRQPVPELPEQVVPVPLAPEERLPEGKGAVEYLQLLWQHRRLLARAVTGGLLVSALLAFLVPARFESTCRLMPPEMDRSAGASSCVAWRRLRSRAHRSPILARG